MSDESNEKLMVSGVIKILIKRCHETALEKGWWEQPREIGTQIALMHSELSEALEDYRVGGEDCLDKIVSRENGKIDGVPAELADVLIRIFDTCGKYNIPLGEALLRKMAYNETREYRHGNKVC